MEYGYSVVRRKLLLKNRGPQDAPGLCARALQAYGHGEYQEALDLAWAAVQLDGQDARFWYAMALSERAVGDVDLARASARHAAALDLLAQATRWPDWNEREQQGVRFSAGQRPASPATKPGKSSASQLRGNLLVESWLARVPERPEAIDHGP